jgi:aminodeoxyfutalosine deaminase
MSATLSAQTRVSQTLVTGAGLITPEREWVPGALVFFGNERVACGTPEDMLAQYPHATQRDTDALLMPGLVNAHTHLELSALRGKLPAGVGFSAWVNALMQTRGGHAEDLEDALASATADLQAAGTVAVGEVTNTCAAAPLLEKSGIRGQVFHEYFGLDASAVSARMAAQQAPVLQNLAYAPSPHTLHTLAPSVLRKFAADAEAGKRMSLHLAEHAGERQLLETGAGELADWLRSRGAELPAALGMGPIAAAQHYGLLRENVLLVHLADATEAELIEVARASAWAILCPRSNAFISGNGPDLPAMLRAGVRIALGTDSLASCNSLDVLEDAQLLYARFGAELGAELAQRLLAFATLGGAEALGLANGALPSDWPFYLVAEPEGGWQGRIARAGSASAALLASLSESGASDALKRTPIFAKNQGGQT